MYKKTSLLFLVLATSLLITSTVFARINETREQCNKRYGTPIKSVPRYSVYSKGNYKVLIYFHNNRAYYIAYKKVRPLVYYSNGLLPGGAKVKPMSGDEIAAFKQVNTRGKKWIVSKTNKTIFGKPTMIAWRTEDKKMSAVYNAKKNHLIVVVNGTFYLMKNRKRNAAEDQGF